MNLSKEFKFGFLLFLGIGFYFLLMEILGLSKLYYLRALNVIIVVYFLNKVIKSNLQEGKTGYIQNLISSGKTGIIGIVLGMIGLITFIYIKGGKDYLNELSQSFLFGGNPTIAEYIFRLFIEGLASVLLVSFINIQYMKTKNVFK